MFCAVRTFTFSSAYESFCLVSVLCLSLYLHIDNEQSYS